MSSVSDMKRPRHSSKVIAVRLTPVRLGLEKEDGALSSVPAAGMATLRRLNQAIRCQRQNAMRGN